MSDPKDFEDDDYLVSYLSDADIWRLARALLAEAGALAREPVNVLALLHRRRINTVFGSKTLAFSAGPHTALRDRDAVTIFQNGAVMIVAQKHVSERAMLGVGRDRMSLAHELGHAVMHQGPPMGRATNANGATRISQSLPGRSAEHQAKVFAAALLINNVAGPMPQDAEEIAIRFGVSLQAASIYLEVNARLRRRQETSQRMVALAAQLRPGKLLRAPAYLQTECPNCGEKLLIEVGAKYLCLKCDHTIDLPDGDHGG